MRPDDVHRTHPLNAVVHASGWVPLREGWEVTAVPLVDVAVTDAEVFARLTYRDALEVARRYGADLIHTEHVEMLHILATQGAAIEVPAYTGTPRAEKTFEHSLRHDAACWAALAAAGWDSRSLTANIGKHWVHGAPLGRSWLMGWWVADVGRYGSSRRGPGFVQGRPPAGSQGPHLDSHHDDGTTTMLVRRAGSQTRPGGSALGSLVSGAVDAAGRILSRLWGTGKAERPMRKTIRLGSLGDDVAAWQQVVGVPVTRAFSASTHEATVAWQEAHGLVGDGIVGRRSWEAAGERYAAPVATSDPRAPACVAALRDANAAWPGRKKASDGIMGDAAHQARPSDHNLGLAVDISHDPASGCDAGEIALMATEDARVTYIIWDRRIWSRARAAEGWRAYSGSNPHTKHCHISVRADARGDASPWPWAPR